MLSSYGLLTKPAELVESVRVLGLQLTDKGGRVIWATRGDAGVDLVDNSRKRELLQVDESLPCNSIAETSMWICQEIGKR